MEKKTNNPKWLSLNWNNNSETLYKQKDAVETKILVFIKNLKILFIPNNPTLQKLQLNYIKMIRFFNW